MEREVEDAGNGTDLHLVRTEIVHHPLEGAEVVPVEGDMMITNPVDDLRRENFLPVVLEVEEGMPVETMISSEEDIPGLEALLGGDTDLLLLHVVGLNLLK